MKYIVQYKWPDIQYVQNYKDIHDPNKISWDIGRTKNQASKFSLVEALYISKNGPLHYKEMKDFKILIDE